MTDILRLLTGGTRNSPAPLQPSSTSTASKKPRVHCSIAVDPLPPFSKESVLPLPLRRSMETLGFPEPTEIQRHLVPLMLGRHDVLATAETGSGKTLAYLLPLFAVLEGEALVLAPTRELANQITSEAERLNAVCSRKVHFSAQGRKERRLVVSTPLKILQQLNAEQVSLEHLEFLVLDEADKLLDLGFLPQLDGILTFYKEELLRRRATESSRPLNAALVSATLPEHIASLLGGCMVEPVRLSIGHVQAANRNVQQRLLFAGSEEGKIPLMRQMAKNGELKPPCIVFVDSKERAIELTNELLFDGLMVDCIHADRTNHDRDNVVAAFRAGKIWTLVATDVLGRGLHFDIEQVINFDVPKTAATYIHRVGRTGRAGKLGQAVTLFTEADVPDMRPIVNVMRESQVEVPEWLVKAVPKRDQRKKNKEFFHKKRRVIAK